MLIDKLEPFLGDTYQSTPDLKFWNILLRKKKPVYGWQGDYMSCLHMNRNWFGLICKELLC